MFTCQMCFPSSLMMMMMITLRHTPKKANNPSHMTAQTCKKKLLNPNKLSFDYLEQILHISSCCFFLYLSIPVSLQSKMTSRRLFYVAILWILESSRSHRPQKTFHAHLQTFQCQLEGRENIRMAEKERFLIPAWMILMKPKSSG